MSIVIVLCSVAFLENATSIELLALQKSKIPEDFGFLKSQKFDRRGVFNLVVATGNGPIVVFDLLLSITYR